jgi:hypothetical protein
MTHEFFFAIECEILGFLIIRVTFDYHAPERASSMEPGCDGGYDIHDVCVVVFNADTKTETAHDITKIISAQAYANIEKLLETKRGDTW